MYLRRRGGEGREIKREEGGREREREGEGKEKEGEGKEKEGGRERGESGRKIQKKQKTIISMYTHAMTNFSIVS